MTDHQTFDPRPNPRPTEVVCPLCQRSLERIPHNDKTAQQLLRMYAILQEFEDWHWAKLLGKEWSLQHRKESGCACLSLEALLSYP